MSFYINNSNPNKPGIINSSALNSICEKVLIEVNKVFDACMIREENNPYVLTVSNFNPENPTFPLHFITIDSIPNQPATIVSANIERLEKKPNFANVTVNFSIPLQVNYTDANGVPGIASSTLEVTKTVVLFVPQDSLSPLQVSAFAFFSSQIGTFTDDNTLSVTGCLQVIIKIVSLVDLLIPSFGYPCLPPCHELSENANSCPTFINQPIYPGTRQI